MWKDALLAYLHFASIFTFIWFLAQQWTLLRMGAHRLDIPRLARADVGYGIAAGAIVLTGIMRVTLGAKPWMFYTGNPMFHAKITLFVIVALISIWPTLAFARWRKALANDSAFQASESEWRKIKRLVMVELHLIALIPIFAVLMARGIGYR